MQRREFLAASGVLGTGLLAGCVSSPDQSVEDIEISKPTVSDFPDGNWELFNEMEPAKYVEKSFAGINVISAYGRSLVYSYLPVKKRMQEYAGGEFQSDLVLFFASHVKLEGVPDFIPDQVYEETIADSLKGNFKGFGAKGVERSDSVPEDIEVESGAVGKWIGFDGRFEESNITIPLPKPDGSTISVPFGRVSVPVKMRAAYWTDGKDVIIGGGAYPIDDIKTESDRFDVEGGDRQGIDAKVWFNFRVNSRQYRNEIEELIKKVEI